jgi:hypothetical protein
MDGLSSPLHDCEKIWLLYPPTQCNLSLMKRADGQHGKLARIGHLLEGGIIVRTSSADAIYIPAGCMHAVFTLHGGFLVALDCTTSKSIWAFAQYLQHGLDVSLDVEGRRECLFFFLESLEVALHNSLTAPDAVRAWLSIENRLRTIAQRDAEWKAAAKEVWGSWDGDVPLHCLDCHCISSEAIDKSHLEQAHLFWLTDTPDVSKSMAGRRNRRGASRKKIP